MKQKYNMLKTYIINNKYKYKLKYQYNMYNM